MWLFSQFILGMHVQRPLTLGNPFPKDRYSMCGSNRVMLLVQFARMCDVLMMVCSETRMYCRKQSLVHLPIVFISHFGHPMAAAVDAAPIRRECDVVLAAPLVVCFSSWLRSFLVRYFLL